MSEVVGINEWLRAKGPFIYYNHELDIHRYFIDGGEVSAAEWREHEAAHRRWLVRVRCCGVEYLDFTNDAEKGFVTREEAQEYCDWRNRRDFPDAYAWPTQERLQSL